LTPPVVCGRPVVSGVGFLVIFARCGVDIDSIQGKFAGLFISTGTLGGGQESTAIAAMSTLAHHGVIYVPLGYKHTFAILADLSEVRGGSAWGAGTFSVCQSGIYDTRQAKTNSSHRVPTVLVSPPPRSSSLPLSKESSSTRPSQRAPD
jgi:hypothetical protein